MALDVGVFDKIKNFTDYQKADQDFQLRKQLAAQQLQTGGIDAASKANIYKTQLLSGAAAGGQAAYDQARQTLQQQGIDTSEYAPDVNTATNQLNTARLAQSPLGSLLNAGAKLTQNDLQAVQTYGSMDNAVKAGYKPEGLALPNMGSYSAPSPNPPPSVATPLQPTPQIAPKVAPSGNNTQLQATGGNALPNGQSDTAATIYPTPAPAPTPSPAPLPKFNPPTQNPGESIAAYNSRAQREFEIWKANPDVLASQKKAEATATKEGDNTGDTLKSLNIMQTNLPTVLNRFQTMRDNSAAASYGTGTNEDNTGFTQNFANNFDGSMGVPGITGATAKANAALKQASSQAVLPELGPMLSQAGVKGNKFLESLANDAVGLNLSAPPAAKQALIDGLEQNYIRNLKATAAQARALGQPSPSDAEIDKMVVQAKGEIQKQTQQMPQGQPAISPSDAINELRRRKKI